MKKRMKNLIKTALVILMAVCIFPQSYALSYGDNVIADPFAAERPVYDVNLDGKFNIVDLVRLKKYTAGAAAAVDLSVFSAVKGDASIGEWSKFNPNYTTVSLSLITPVSSVSQNGIYAKPVNGNKLETENNSSIYVKGRSIYAAIQLENPKGISEGDGIVFYLKTEAANTILPMLAVSDPKITSYDPDMALKVGAEYFYMPLGGNWIASTVTETGYSARPAYFGLISFDQAFEGYVKLPFSSLSNDAPAVAVLDEENYIKRVICMFKGLGGEYGNAVFGPFFIYSDGDVNGVGYAQAITCVKKALLAQ